MLPKHVDSSVVIGLRFRSDSVNLQFKGEKSPLVGVDRMLGLHSTTSCPPKTQWQRGMPGHSAFYHLKGTTRC